MFYDPATKRQPTDEQLRADWDAASKLLRRYYPNANLENTSAGDGYADVCKMRMHPEALVDKMASVLKAKLKSELENWLPLETSRKRANMRLPLQVKAAQTVQRADCQRRVHVRRVRVNA